jgi:chemotaxis-related protein WspD
VTCDCPLIERHGHRRDCPAFIASARALLERPAPAGYLEAWQARLAAGQPAAVAESSLLVFRLEREWLAWPSAACAEIGEKRPIHRLAHRANHLLLGLVNVRGELQLAVSLHRLLGLTPAASEARLLVAVLERVIWVFPVDEVHGVLRVPTAELGEAPATLARAQSSHVTAVWPWTIQDETRRVGVLSAPAVFAALHREIG